MATSAPAGNVSTSNPAAMIERSVSRWVWQLPNSLGHNVASAKRCKPTPRTGAGHMLEIPQLPSWPQQRIQTLQHAVGVAHRAQHQRAHHRVERLSATEASAVSPVTTTRTGTTAAAARAWAASRRLGLHRDHLFDRLRVVAGSSSRYPRRLPTPGPTGRPDSPDEAPAPPRFRGRRRRARSARRRGCRSPLPYALSTFRFRCAPA